MNIREQFEQLELKTLSSLASLSMNTAGRKVEEEKCQIRTEFQRDRDRVIHSKAFRRLKHKTQVFIAPEGDHFRTRLTHTLEVAQLARTMARALRLNEDLVEAIALAHDLGHTPFGHTGEKVLDRVNPRGFKHNEQSVRVVELLEGHEKRQGLNLTYEVLEGIMNHSGDNVSKTPEGQIIKFADRIAYINHDIDDAIRAGVIEEKDLPDDCVQVLGDTHGKRINTMIVDLIENNIGKDRLIMSNLVGEKTSKLRQFMFDNVYLNKDAKKEDDKAEYIIEVLFKYYKKNFNRLPSEHLGIYEGVEADKEDIICDYIAGMTDRYIVNLYMDIFVPKPWGK
ncbi:deoxyguanosinetriphosphate triphosphohydrolase [Gudongella sp. DL1XJH-153]|uniref:deoxyguanosinetriphosphate triphosphohydrolase n=1 Tax=Gudongella sp. DL1XJH-153 TaxID=3409804 RepID=UPI003BB53BA8